MVVRERLTLPKLGPQKLSRLSLRKVARSYLALTQRPALRADLETLLPPVAEALSARVGKTVKLEARLMEAAAEGSRGLASPAVFALFSLDAIGGQAILEIDGAVAVGLVDQLAGGEGGPVGPVPLSEMEEAGLSLLLLEVLQALHQGACEDHLAPRLLRLVLSAAEISALCDLRAPQMAVRIAVESGACRGGARLLLPVSALRRWLELTAPEPRSLAREVGEAALELTVRTGLVALSIADFHELLRGDVLLLDGLRRESEVLTGRARVRGPLFTITGELGLEGFTVEGFSIREKRTMNDKTEIMSAPALPVEVEVELARVRMSLSELGALQAGGIVPLRIGLGEPVTLKVGDRAVAVAELVDIEGEIGARILRLGK